MKLLHVTDLHFHRPWFRWVAAKAPCYDALAISGDLLNECSEIPFERQAHWVSRWLCQLPVPTVVCSGNHDIDVEGECEWLRKLPEAREQLTCDRGMLRLGRWTIEAVPWRGLPLRGGDHHVVVTHVPPAGAPTARGRADECDWGDPKLTRHLRDAADAPWLILSGHEHEPMHWQARWRQTWSLNPLAKTEGSSTMPNHIVVDLTKRTAAWRCGNGRRSLVRLS